MVVIGAIEVFGYVHILHPQLSPMEVAIGINQTAFAQSERFDLGTDQYNARRVNVQNLVIESGTFVLYEDILLYFLFHSCGYRYIRKSAYRGAFL